ncbi:MAG: MAPEG family protein [Halioglobus sp.]
MNSVLTALLALTILPWVCAWMAGYFKHKQLGTVDNKNPRLQSAELTGAGARVVAAQANTWEALAIFSAAVLAVFISGVPMEAIANLALIFTGLRILYIVAYLANQDALRSAIWLGSYGICMYFFYLAFGAG